MMLMASPSKKKNFPPIFQAVKIAKRAAWASPQVGSPTSRDFEQAWSISPMSFLQQTATVILLGRITVSKFNFSQPIGGGF